LLRILLDKILVMTRRAVHRRAGLRENLRTKISAHVMTYTACTAGTRKTKCHRHSAAARDKKIFGATMTTPR
jgi:hypothetical protein